MARRYITREQDKAFITSLMKQACKDWKPGDPCRPYKGTQNTTVARVEGDIVYLANGESLHRSKMRDPWPPEPE